MKKPIVTVGYLLGWIYPISAIIINLLNVSPKLMSAFDFGNDSIMFYLFYGSIFSIITYIIYFLYFYKKFDVKKRFLFYLYKYFLVLSKYSLQYVLLRQLGCDYTYHNSCC